MKAQARQGVAQGSGGRATPWSRHDQKRGRMLTDLAVDLLPALLLIAVAIPPPVLIVTVRA